MPAVPAARLTEWHQHHSASGPAAAAPQYDDPVILQSAKTSAE